jgi:MFS family permease
VSSVIAPLRSRPFRYLVIGSTVDRLGNAIAPVALAFAVLDLTGSATSLGIVVGARSLANVIFLLLGGVVADRLPRSVILVGSSLASAATQALVAALVFARTDSVALLAVLSAVNGTLSAFALPASVALVPQTVSADQLVPANAFARMGANIASLFGVAAAGIVVAGLGSAWGIAIDAATFAVAAVFFGCVRINAAERPKVEHASVLRDLIDGWQAFITRTWLWVVVAAFGVINMAFAGGVTVLGPVVADETVGRRAWGFVLGAEAVGLLVGGLFAMRLRMRRLLLFGVVCMLPLCLPLFALAAHTSLVGLLVAFLVSGLGVEQFAVAWQTCMQRHVPPEMLARLTSYDMLGSFIAIPLGEVAAGPLSHAIGVRPTLVACGLVIVVAIVAMIAAPSVRNLLETEKEVTVETVIP